MDDVRERPAQGTDRGLVRINATALPVMALEKNPRCRGASRERIGSERRAAHRLGGTR